MNYKKAFSVVLFLIVSTYYLLAVIYFLLSPITTLKYANTERVTYPLEWLSPIFSFIMRILLFPVNFFATENGIAGFAQLIIFAHIFAFLLIIVMLIIGKQILKKGFYFLILFCLFFNSITVSLGFMLSSLIVSELSKVISSDYYDFKQNFEKSDIKFTLESVKLTNVQDSIHFKGGKMRVYEVRMRIENIPTKLKKFSFEFNELNFNNYQIYRFNGKSGYTWNVNVDNNNGVLSFRDNDSGKVLNDQINQNVVNFVIAVELKPSESKNFQNIEIRPEVNIKIENPDFVMPSLGKSNYPSLVLQSE